MQTSEDPRNLKLCVDRVLPRDMARRKQLLTAPRTRGERPRPRLAIVGVKRWDTGRTLRVSFLDGEPEVHQKVEHYARQWNPYANIGFEFGEFDDADIRISFLHPGSWSYIGVDARAIDPPEPTMNYGWLYPETADDEYRRVVLHEFGHALGAIHEHSSPGVAIPWNRQAVYDSYTGPPNNWTREQVDINLFKLYEEDVTQYSGVRSRIHHAVSDPQHPHGRRLGGWVESRSVGHRQRVDAAHLSRSDGTAEPAGPRR